MKTPVVKPKATIRYGSGKKRYTLSGPQALSFYIWWKSPELAKDGKGNTQKVEFFESPGDWWALPSGAKGGYTRSSLVCTFENIPA